MKFEKTQVFNFEGAFRGMRNPKNSWDRSDSYFGIACNEENVIAKIPDGNKFEILSRDEEFFTYASLGTNDLKLAQTLIKGGSEHRKFLRQIFVSVDITASLFWFKEFDTYKVGTVANSTSTMHKLTSKPITLDCFEIDDFTNIVYPEDTQREELKYPVDPDVIQMVFIPYLEYLRQKYLETEDKRYWKELVRWLPESWLQTRTITMNYENLRSMYFQRKYHKLNEWSGKDDPDNDNFIKWVESLPYAKELIMYEGDTNE